MSSGQRNNQKNPRCGGLTGKYYKMNDIKRMNIELMKQNINRMNFRPYEDKRLLSGIKSIGKRNEYEDLLFNHKNNDYGTMDPQWYDLPDDDGTCETWNVYLKNNGYLDDDKKKNNKNKRKKKKSKSKGKPIPSRSVKLKSVRRSKKLKSVPLLPPSNDRESNDSNGTDEDLMDDDFTEIQQFADNVNDKYPLTKNRTVISDDQIQLMVDEDINLSIFKSMILSSNNQWISATFSQGSVHRLKEYLCQNNDVDDKKSNDKNNNNDINKNNYNMSSNNNNYNNNKSLGCGDLLASGDLVVDRFHDVTKHNMSSSNNNKSLGRGGLLGFNDLSPVDKGSATKAPDYKKLSTLIDGGRVAIPKRVSYGKRYLLFLQLCYLIKDVEIARSEEEINALQEARKKKKIYPNNIWSQGDQSFNDKKWHWRLMILSPDEYEAAIAENKKEGYLKKSIGDIKKRLNTIWKDNKKDLKNYQYTFHINFVKRVNLGIGNIWESIQQNTK